MIRCDWCGPLDWTIAEYGQVSHKHGCPYNEDSFCQAHPLGCERGGDQRSTRVTVELPR